MTHKLSESERPYRTHRLSELSSDDLLGSHLVLSGWVEHRRDLGGIVFLVLRDRYARLQLVFDPDETPAGVLEKAGHISLESVIRVEGVLRLRVEEQRRSGELNGDRELVVHELEVLSAASPLPLRIADDAGADELTRLRFRYLDLRRPPLHRAMSLRHRVVLTIRNYFDRLGFIEVETPMLGRSTPEGARDYLVPSRVHKGKFYALPQSPQLYKQLLMVAGYDRYFQIARCLRDEDLRADRQPEHTQVDVEVSFATRDELFAIGEGMFAEVFRQVLSEELELPFPRLTYDQVIRRFGSDKPDLRYGLEITDLTDWARECGLNFIEKLVAEGAACLALAVEEVMSRSQVERLERKLKELGSPGLAWLAFAEGERRGAISRGMRDQAADRLRELVGLADSGTVLFQIGSGETPYRLLGELRNLLIKELDLEPERKWAFLWVVDFPLFEPDDEAPRGISPSHHPFTMPRLEDLEKLSSDDPAELLSIRADCYDLVLNGSELGSGSLRVWQPEVQRKIFAGIGLSPAEAEEKFGWFLEAFRYGAPPHRGFALGLDRIVALLGGYPSIRDVIAFPKTASASDPMTGAPAEVDPAQLRELGILLEGE